MDATTTTTTTDSSERQISASYGRYRGWKSVCAAPKSDFEELPTEQQPQQQQQDANAQIGDTEMTSDDVPAATESAATTATSMPSTVVVQFEATAREDFRVGFAPPRVGREPSQWAYEVAIGYSGNTEVVWRKHVASTAGSSARTTEREADLNKVFAGRTCSPQDFVAYWIVVQQGVLVFGIGDTVGNDTVAKFVDGDFVAVTQVAFTTWDTPATVRNVTLTAVYDAPLDVDRMAPGTIVRADPSGRDDLVTPAERAEFERACEAAKRRADRFGGSYVPPAIKTFVDPKTVRALQRTGAVDPGFATGFDLTSHDELSKREQRMKRFNTPEFALAYSTESVRALTDGLTQEQWAEQQRDKEKLRERALKFGLPVDEARGVRELDLAPATAKVRSERRDVDATTSTCRVAAIHMYALDDRFQQVRTSDVLAYFVGYGPSYVEWINDSACTVVFEDSFTAGRALVSRSEEIPLQYKPAVEPEADTASATPAADDVEMDSEGAPATAADVLDDAFNGSQWRYGQAIGSSSQPSHKKWRVLLRKATDDDLPAEKTHKKYHERAQSGGRGSHRQMSQRSRGHRESNNNSSSSRSGRGDSSGSSMPSRYSTSASASGSRARAHPYGSSSRRRGNRDDNDDNDRDFDDDDASNDRSRSRRSNRVPRDTGKPSDRIRENADGSISVVRPGATAAFGSDNALQTAAPTAPTTD